MAAQRASGSSVPLLFHARMARAPLGSGPVLSHLPWKRDSRPILMLRDPVASSDGLGERQVAGAGVLTVLKYVSGWQVTKEKVCTILEGRDWNPQRTVQT